MRSKNKCKTPWEAWEKPYLEKPGGKQEAAREKREFYCDNGTIKMRPTDDADVPLTDVNLTNIVEVEDETDLAGELACAGGACEIV